MSIDRRFIRVTNQWSEAFTPGENDQYVVNISGYTVKLFLSATQIDPSTITKEFFTIGGNITQIKVDKGMYAYLTAVIADGEDTAVIADYEKMPLTDIEYLQDELEKSINQIMRLSDRVTKTELKLVRNKINLKRFTREWLHALASTDKYLSDTSGQILSLMERVYTVEGVLNEFRANTEYHNKVEYSNIARTFISQANNTNLAITDIDKHMLDIWDRLYGAESSLRDLGANSEYHNRVEYPRIVRTFIAQANNTNIAISNINQQILDIWDRLYVAEKWMIAHGSEYSVLRDAVDSLLDSGDSVEIDKSIMEALTSVVARMSDVENDLRAANAEIDNLKNNPSADVSELKSKINTLDANFAALNNAIINLSYSYSDEEIEELFGMMINTVPADMVPTVTAVKDDLIRLSKTTDILDSIEDGSIVTTSNNYILGDLSASDLADNQ